jgi:histidinol dehydrogenase
MSTPEIVADEAIAGVRARGDEYVREQNERFAGAPVPAAAMLDGAPLMAAIDAAIERIESFHFAQLPVSYRWTRGGTEVIHRVRPLRRVGIYVPGGRAVYVSTLLMCAVPARIAGVRELVVATPPSAADNEALQYACTRLGITEIYRAGGASAIAAMALGTQSLGRVDKIVGPGNAYVTAAKARLVGTVGIDMTAGPTELVVIADDSADAAFVQADLDAQAEHGEDSVVTCICVGRALDVRATRIVVVSSIDEAIDEANRIAPEHVSVQTRDAAAVAERIDDCGAVFVGPFSPVAAGDYVAGPNHVLPTSGTARFFSPLGVYDFVKRSNVITLDAASLAEIAPFGETLATIEGLPAHAASLAVRRTTCAAS